MKEFMVKMGENGRIVIPAIFRAQMHLSPGEELIFRLEDNELHVFSLKHSLQKAQSLVKHYAKNQNLLVKLKKLREEDEK